MVPSPWSNKEGFVKNEKWSSSNGRPFLLVPPQGNTAPGSSMFSIVDYDSNALARPAPANTITNAIMSDIIRS